MGMLDNKNKKSRNWANNDRKLSDFQPDKMASIDDLEKKDTIKSKPKVVTFNTNLKISNHARNMLQSLVTLGYTSTQKDGIELLYQTFFDTLSDDQQKELDMQYKTLERRDARMKKRL